MSEKMVKEEKQKMMIDGAVFEIAEQHLEFRFTKGRFVYLNMYNQSDRGEIIAESCYSSMTLKTPPPKPEYSREYEIIPPHRMAYLMEVEGEVLEFENSRMDASFDRDAKEFKILHGIMSDNIVNWGLRSRVKQAPKMETRYQWLYKNLEGVYEATRQHYATGADAKGSLKNTRPERLIKIEESKDEFEVGE